MVGQADDHPLASTRAPGPRPGCASLLVDDAEDLGQRAAGGGSLVRPQSDSATGFMKVTRPPSSVTITASPMLPSVTRGRPHRSRRVRSDR